MQSLEQKVNFLSFFLFFSQTQRSHMLPDRLRHRHQLLYNVPLDTQHILQHRLHKHQFEIKTQRWWSSSPSSIRLQFKREREAKRSGGGDTNNKKLFRYQLFAFAQQQQQQEHLVAEHDPGLSPQHQQHQQTQSL